MEKLLKNVSSKACIIIMMSIRLPTLYSSKNAIYLFSICSHFTKAKYAYIKYFLFVLVHNFHHEKTKTMSHNN